MNKELNNKLLLVDIYGADKGIDIPIKAVINIMEEIDSEIILVGKKDDIFKVFEKLRKQKYLEKIQILECSEYITNNDEPANAIKNKKNSNLVVAFDYMKTNDNTILISASNTGALMAGGLLKLGRIKGIKRPAFMTLMPTMDNKEVVFLDAGASLENISCLVQYAKLGEIYCKNILKIESPKIALLNVGVEEEKGTTELKKVYKELKEQYPNFIGNIEARYILFGKADVVVCDGLLGNIALKSMEGVASVVKQSISKEFNKNIYNKFIGLLAKPILSNSLKKFNYKEKGGGILLGIKKPVIKVHGSSDTLSYMNAIKQAEEILQKDIINIIVEEYKTSD